MTDPRKNTRDVYPPDRPGAERQVLADRGAARMMMNNLHPDVAENPHELVVYGGIGRAARTWKDFDLIVATLKELEGDETLLVQSGKPVACSRPTRCAAGADRQLQPGAPLGDLGSLQRARPQGPDDVRPDDRRLVDLYRQPGHRPGHLRDLRRGRPPALRRRPHRQVDPDRRPGRHGRRPAAGRNVMAGACCLAVECNPTASISACAPATWTRSAETPGRGPGHDRPLDRRARPSPWACSATPPRSSRSWRKRGAACARHRDRPDLGARPGERLPAGRAGAWPSGSDKRKATQGGGKQPRVPP